MEHKFHKGGWVWVKHSVEVWIPATVCDLLNDCDIQLLFPDGNTRTMKITPENPIPRHICCDGDTTSVQNSVKDEEDHTDIIDDLTKIPQITTPAALHLLRVAYLREQYYCKLGSGTLLALNPFKEVPDLISTKMVRLYSSSTLKKLQNLPAHVYAVAQSALTALQARTGKINQSIIVSGESGAGKTCTVRCLMRFLAEVEESHDINYQYKNVTLQNNYNSRCVGANDVSAKHIPQSSPTEISDMSGQLDYHGLKNKSDTVGVHSEHFMSVKSHEVVDNIEKRVLNSNPVLEAFGNAQTTRNNNSSRFGKYIQLQYGRSGLLIGAQLKTYLLEKTRVVHHDHGERCYHIFYQMLYGASQKQQEDWRLLSDPFSEDIEPASDEMYMEHRLNFSTTVRAMKKLGISVNMQDRIFKVLSAILHLRQLNFEGLDDLQNPCDISQDDPEKSKCLTIASELLGLDEQTVQKVVTLRRISSYGSRKKSIFLRPSTVRECYIRRDCLLKFIYQILFEWIVRGVQERIRSANSENCSFLGLLDIYGFESFENNSLEQLCINFANEKLQNHFCTTFIMTLQDECSDEGVQDVSWDLAQTEACLRALEAPRNSLFSLLNEECRLDRANAECNLKSRIGAVFSENEHIKLPRISSAGSCFTISHFAGLVSYKTEFLIEKNKDEIPVEFIETLAMSKNGFVRQLVSYCRNVVDISDSSASVGVKHEHVRHAKPMPTVVMRFKKSLDELLGIISSTDCHYIRCIKPNKESIPMVFDAQFVLGQMEACGIVDTIRVCSSVYSCRMTYEQFHSRYFFVQQFPKDLPGGNECLSSSHTASLKEKCLAILKSIPIKGDNLIGDTVQFGRTKLFLSTDLFESLEFFRSGEIWKRCVIIQSVWRKYSNKMKCKAKRKMMIAERMEAATVLQRAWRAKLNVRLCRRQRKQYISTIKRSVAVIESAWISYSVRKKVRLYSEKIQLERYAIKIQASFRGWSVRRRYKHVIAEKSSRNIMQELECRDLDGQSADLISSQVQSHVTYFELISNGSVNGASEPRHPEAYRNKLPIYQDNSACELSSPDIHAGGDARRIVLLDYQDVQTRDSRINFAGDTTIVQAAEYMKANHSYNCHKLKDAKTVRHAYRRSDFCLDKRLSSTGNTVNLGNLYRNADNSQPHCHEIIMASAWHRLPSASIMSCSMSFSLPFYQSSFITSVWNAHEYVHSHSPNVCPVAMKNLYPKTGKHASVICDDFVPIRVTSSILRYADVQPNE